MDISYFGQERQQSKRSTHRVVVDLDVCKLGDDTADGSSKEWFGRVA